MGNHFATATPPPPTAKRRRLKITERGAPRRFGLTHFSEKSFLENAIFSSRLTSEATGLGNTCSSTQMSRARGIQPPGYQTFWDGGQWHLEAPSGAFYAVGHGCFPPSHTLAQNWARDLGFKTVLWPQWGVKIADLSWEIILRRTVSRL